ncbi:MAG: AraC family transcriptional regulator [Butyrivibrio sp.]|nr:AraC family transcriptional regulator [Butyrivibrio sp.]
MIIVEGIGSSYVHSNGWNINRPNGTGNYLFLHIETPADILIGDNWHYYSEPCFILFKKGQPQVFHDHEGNKYIDSWVHFDYDKNNSDTDDIAQMIDSLNIPCGKPHIIYNTIELVDLWHLADAEFHQNGEHRLEIMDMKMKTLLYKFADILHSESTTSSKFNRYRKAFGELRNNIYSGNNAALMNDITALAEAQNMSVSYFEHVYKELFEVPVTRDIIKSRITYARYLLHSTNRSIQDIAQFCGYENVEHFTRQFKKITGFTPSQYRNA